MSDQPVTWLAEHTEDGAVCFRIGTNGPEVIAEWCGLAMLVARRDGSDPRLTFEPGASPREAEKIRQGSAWLLQRHLEGRLAMHGSSVVALNQAVVFLGRSGAGKSTFAAAMCLRGAQLLADDAVAIDSGTNVGEWLVEPREVNHWLDPASRAALGGHPSGRGKEPIRAAVPARSAAPLAMFVALGFGGNEPKLHEQYGFRAVASLVPQVARFVLDEPERQRRELDLLHTMVSTVPVFCLERPRSFDCLASAVDLVLDLLGSERWKV